MATVKELKATARPQSGKGAARAERRAGRVPGVIYGNNQPPVTISAGQDALAQFLVVDRNGHGGLVVAVDHSGHSPGATLCPGGPLAALRTRGRLQFLDGRHRVKSLFSKKLK